MAELTHESGEVISAPEQKVEAAWPARPGEPYVAVELAAEAVEPVSETATEWAADRDDSDVEPRTTTAVAGWGVAPDADVLGSGSPADHVLGSGSPPDSNGPGEVANPGSAVGMDDETASDSRAWRSSETTELADRVAVGWSAEPMESAGESVEVLAAGQPSTAPNALPCGAALPDGAIEPRREAATEWPVDVSERPVASLASSGPDLSRARSTHPDAESARHVLEASQNEVGEPGVDQSAGSTDPLVRDPATALPESTTRAVPPEWGSRAPHASLVHPWGQTIRTPLPGDRVAVAPGPVSRETTSRPPAVPEVPILIGPPAARSTGSTPSSDARTDSLSMEPVKPSVANDVLTDPAPGPTEGPSQPEPHEAWQPDDTLVSDSEPGDDGLRLDGSAAMQQQDSSADVSARPHVAVVEEGLEVTLSSAWQPPGAPLAAPTPFDDSDRVQLVASLPTVDDSTPLAAEVAEDARRRISLTGRSFPRPPHTRIMTVANQKGGVGKTTTTVNVAAALAQSGLSVLVLDIDPQGNASTALGIDHHAEVPSLYDVVVEDRPLVEVVQPCPDLPNLWVAPATIDLAGAEIELVSFVAREVRLKKALETYLDLRLSRGLDQIDYVLIDCPPSLSLLTVNAFVAAREVLIPIQCEYYALEGLSQLLKHIELIRRQLNPTLHVSTIMLTMYDGRTRLSAQVADEVRTHFPEQVVKTSVPRSVRISEAPSHGQTVMTYDPASSGALSYLEAARELAEQVLTWEPTMRKEQS
jgi:chromosome partitioning protein